MEQNALLKKILISAILVLIACVSIFLIARLASANENLTAIQSSIDQKTQRVLGMSASAAAISTGMSFLPGDVGSPIAQEIADLSGYFLLILCILYTEKNLLALIGAAVFKFVIPFACLLLIGEQFIGSRQLRGFAVKLAVLALAVFLAIPGSIALSDAIYENHKEIVETTAAEAEQMQETSSQLSEAEETRNPISAILNKLQESTSGLLKKGTDLLNHYVESIAIFIVTTCVIPILSLAFFLWVIDKLVGVKIDFPDPRRRRRSERAGREEQN